MHIKLSDLLNNKKLCNIDNSNKNLCIIPTLYVDCNCNNSKNKHKHINHLFIFCAGPITNVLAYQLVQQEDKNIYLDIGSSLDEELGLGKGTRNHNKLFGWKTISTCYWNKPLKWYQISCDSKGKSKCFRLFLRIVSLIYKIYIWLFNG